MLHSQQDQKITILSIWLGFIGPVRKLSPVHSGQLSLTAHLSYDKDDNPQIRWCGGTLEAQRVRVGRHGCCYPKIGSSNWDSGREVGSIQTLPCDSGYKTRKSMVYVVFLVVSSLECNNGDLARFH